MATKMNHMRTEPQIAMWVSQVQELVTRPALKHTVMTTYWKHKNNTLLSITEKATQNITNTYHIKFKLSI